MSFLYPTFLYALSAVIVPVIIHLFNFRKFKRLYFSNVKFLKEVKEQTQSKYQLKHLLILFSRIFAIVFLVFAFAQPYIPSDVAINVGQKAISVYIDNSFSMDGVNDNGRLLNQAKKAAYEISKSYQATDLFQLLTNDFEEKHQRFVSSDEFNQFLDEVELSSSVKSLSEVVSRQLNSLKSNNNASKLVFIISDFQKSIANVEALLPDTFATFRFIPIQAQTSNNLYIDTCWFDNPSHQLNQLEGLNIRLSNKSDQDYDNIPVRLSINNNQKALASFSIAAGSHLDTVINYTNTSTGIYNGEISITDYPITFDDKLYFSYTVDSLITILAINERDTSKSFYSLFGKDSYFKLTQTTGKNIDYSQFPKNNLIILNGLKNISSGLTSELEKIVKTGATILLFPSDDINESEYNEFLVLFKANRIQKFDTSTTTVSSIDVEHPLFSGVFEKIPENMDLPVLNGHYTFSSLFLNLEERLMVTMKGNTFLSKFQYSNGALYICSAPLNEKYSNFSKHAIFVPVLYKIAVSGYKSNDLYQEIGTDETIEISARTISTDNVFHVVSKENNFDVIPEFRPVNSKIMLLLHNQLRKSGNYEISTSNETVKGVSFNYNRKESDLTMLSLDEIRVGIESIGLSKDALITANSETFIKKLSETAEGKKLWIWCITITLLFFGIESLLMRLWK